MHEEQFVYIPVPTRWTSRVHTLLAELGESEGQPPTEPEKPAALTPELVREMYRDSRDKHRRLMEYLAGHSDRWHYTSDIARELALPNGAKAVAGMLGAFARRSNHRYRGLVPWITEWDSEREEARHMVTFDTARWINRAIQEEADLEAGSKHENS